MIQNPFSLLQQFRNSFDCEFLTKEDNVKTDTDISRVTGHSKIASLWQAHGNIAVRVSGETSRSIKADALFTDEKGLTLTIRFADCQNFVVYAPEKNVIGLIHAGWRGVCSKIITSSFELLKKEWGIDPQDCFVAAGPSLCTKCADFTDPKAEAPELSAFIKENCIDLRAAADSELFSLGVLPKNVERLPDCTREHPNMYWTYRGGDREKVKEGFINCLAVTLRI